MLVALLFILTFSGGVLGSCPTENYEELCPRHEHFTRNDPTCSRNCGNLQLLEEARLSCEPYTGCVCDNGYVRLYYDGTGPCVRPRKCELCPRHEHFTRNDPTCSRNCGNLQLLEEARLSCEPYTGCVCDNGYVRLYYDGTGPCVRPSKCVGSRGHKHQYSSNAYAASQSFASSSHSSSDATSSSHSSSASSSVSSSSSSSSVHIGSGYGECNGDPNASPSDCTSSCPATCAQPYTADLECVESCDASGCECNPGYVLSSIGGRCVLLEDCPVFLGYRGCNGDPNASPSDCTSCCQATCAQPYTDGLICDEICDPSGCECNPGYVLSSIGGICIPLDECPGYGGCNGDPNASPTNYASSCPATCAQPYTDGLVCDYPYDPSGCECNPGYVLSSIGGRCIPLEDCPGYGVCNGDPNASPCECPSSCPATCAQPYTDDYICDDLCDPSGCQCNPGYVLSSIGGRCIPLEDCPGCNGDPNASPSDCTSCCQATCAQPYTDGLICDESCYPSGCECKPGYVIYSIGGSCIPLEDCPGYRGCNGDPNASPSDCTGCRPTCAQPYTDGLICDESYDRSGCECNPGYVLSYYGGRCIPLEDCPGYRGCNGDPNASPSDCTGCRPTCAQPYTDGLICDESYDRSGCECNPGYVLSYYGGRCIPLEDCPGYRGCNGDPNASPSDCTGCRPTCAQPYTDGLICDESYDRSGCECNPGYVLSYYGGRCIPLEDCPGYRGCNGDPNASPSDCTGCRPTCAQPYTDGLICDESYDRSGCECNPGYVLSYYGGRCIPLEDCPGYRGCNGDPNASPSDCTGCRPTCAQPYTDGLICDESYDRSGCECNPGYVLSYYGGRCIPLEDCPGYRGCNGDPNASPSDCASSCPATCAQPYTDGLVCDYPYDPSGCECNPGYVLSSIGGRCIPLEDCPAYRGCNGDPNATLKECPSACPATCDEPDVSDIFCSEVCAPIGCECNPGFILDKIGGRCIRLEECPGNRQCRDPNASPVDCPSSCQPTCAQPDTRDIICIRACLPSGCVCNSGYILNKPGGKCIPIKDCPCNLGCNGDPNAVINECPSFCPPTCNQPDTSNVYCIAMCDPSRCVCKPGYILTEKGGICIRPEQCPAIGCNGDPNAIADDCPSYCPPTCAQPDTSNLYCPAVCDPSGCVCRPGYILTEKGGRCVRPEECPDIGCNGDPNAMADDCPSSCPPTCARPNTYGMPCIAMCDPSGCVCKPGYILTKKGGRCIRPDQCPSSPQCGPNEVPTDCAITCPPQSCDSIYINYYCALGECTPGCNCIEGYLRDRSGICIPSDQCPPAPMMCGPNEVPTDCAITCPPQSCESIYTTYMCADIQCSPGCNCIDGYLRDRFGMCIPSDQCPPANPGCNGDPNASPNDYPSSCPPTCRRPDTTGMACIDMFDPSGCVCNPGYILTKKGGYCVEPSQCPGGAPSCPRNKTYVSCYVGCPTNYCPQDDNIGMIACDPPYPCPPGCACQGGYLMLSYDNPRCVLASECPPVECTRPNEVWEPFPLACLRERCDDIDTECYGSYPAPPRCVCAPGYKRNQEDICVPESECNIGCKGDPNAVPHDCPSSCPPTCAMPDTSAILCIDACDPWGCVCKPGYILSEMHGKCIRPDQCPDSQQCNGDRNATRRECPNPCPPTCADPDIAGKVCPAICLETGCECKQGYILNERGGQCISPGDCPGGTPTCGENKTYVDCFVGCPPSYCPVDDSRGFVVCSVSFPCSPGCACIDGYLMLSYEDPKCILPSECPPVNCTRPNEVWDPHPSNCYFENCEDMNRECGDSSSGPPRCVCKPGYYRNQSGICIPASECITTTCNGDPNAIPHDCPSSCPPTCEQPNTKGMSCIQACDPSGCVCKPGFILTKVGGKCVKPAECPNNQQCNGDRNATIEECPSLCQATCAAPDTDRPCPAICLPIGCVCKPGYLRITKDGPCIKPEDCPSPMMCGPNEVPTDCAITCPPQSCESIYTTYMCADIQCSPGCNCIDGYLRDRFGMCIPSDQCPPANPGCNGDPNASPNDCPSSCPPTCCQPDTTGMACIDMCDPSGCVCNPGYILTKKGGYCVEPSQCPGGAPSCPKNKTYVSCYVGCPTNYCPQDDNTGMIACDPPYPCPPGCACQGGYLMLSYDNPRCVLASECPPVECTRPNEVWEPFPPACYRERCDDIDTECYGSYPAPPRCVCAPGYKRNQEDICIPESECNIGCKGDPNAVPHDCPSSCPPTCAMPDTSAILCIDACDPWGCVCKPGYILSEMHGKCIRPDQCPDSQQCNGDRNATRRECPNPCPPTCADPDIAGKVCPAICLETGCECKQGYILNERGGQCISPGDCPGGTPTCGENKTYVDCFVGCPPSYCPVDDSRGFVVCSVSFPCSPGCACIDGYLMLSYEDPKCILPSECPPVNCTRPNEVWDPHPSNCYFENCEDMNRECGDSSSGPPRCVCKPGYYRNQSGICIPASECITTTCNGDPNAIPHDCPSSCPPTCEQPNTKGMSCIQACDPSGCVCKPGFILTKVGGICVKPEECPNNQQCNGDRNATIDECPSVCQATCAAPDTDIPCPAICLPIGCVCKPGYLRITKDGPCIKPEDCPCGSPTCGANKTYVPCKVGCPTNYCPQSDTRAIVACSMPYPCPPGCVCIRNHLMLSYEDQRCVLASECPPVNCTRPNEVWDPTPSNCYLERCEDMDAVCDNSYPSPPRCVCKPGYYRDKDDICIPAWQCPKPLKCGLNEIEVECRTICPPQNCEIAYTDYGCDDYKNICERGCDCLPNHLRNGSGICILNDNCPYPSSPICGVNEIARDCRQICPPQTCQSRYALYRCREDIPCEPGCDCVPNYLRNSDGLCIPADKCDLPPVSTVCPVPDKCIRTCASPNPPNCPYEPPNDNIDGCECKRGYILSEVGGKCIKIEDCPKDIACHGDPNAQPKQCPAPCPSTCDSPDAIPCYKMCDPIGCECKDGYLLSNSTGQCILPEECPGGDPCGPNGYFVSCRSDCPTNFCPVDDSRDPVVCIADPNSCLSGCNCNLNHKKLSHQDRRCIVSSDCPPVDCTRPNEVWDACPSDCFSGYCEDRENQDTICFTLVLNCQPKCVCKRDTFRNASDICVPACECPPLPPVCTIPDECIRTCASPNPSNCPYKPAETNIDGCECIEGYILSDVGGKCIRIQDCPKDVPCNGDPNAQTVQYPAPCPSTCKSPDATPCKRMSEPIGCECKLGYMLSNSTGQCILPDECPCGNPCGPNADFVPCKVNCPTDYCPVDDSRDIPSCEPGPTCLSGCVCKLNHKRKSRKDRRCIVSSDCPPVRCTRPNEKWSKCPSACLKEACKDINNQPQVCQTPALNCQPQCICKKNFFRNATDICVCPDEC